MVPAKEQKGKPNTKQSLAASAANETKTPPASGTIYLYWPRPASVLGFLDKYSNDLPVFLDDKRIGGVKVGEYLMVTMPPGEHSVGLDVGMSGGRLLKKASLLG